jgi:DNA-binding LacI/PurR family transcriptional regulator
MVYFLEVDCMTPTRRPTIKDVAKAAGVTYPTVSRVLSNKPYVATETKKRVLTAISELGYRPSAAARSMVTQRTHLIAMLVPHLTDPNFGILFSGAEREARQHGYSVLVADFDSASDNGGILAEHRVDGVLVLEPQNFHGQYLTELPIVELDDAPIDHRDGGRLVAKHLSELKHQKVIFVGGPNSAPHASGRYAGLLEYYPNAPWLAGDWTAESGYGLLEAALENKPSAIFAANDYVALGLVHALRNKGLGVPQDISLVGFDDIPLAKHFTPALTTVQQPLEIQGSRAAALLIAKLRGQPLPPTQVITPHLIIRESTVKFEEVKRIET